MGVGDSRPVEGSRCRLSVMSERNRDTRLLLLVFGLIAAFELFRPAPAMTQRSVADHMRDVVYELRGIRQELSSIERKMK